MSLRFFLSALAVSAAVFAQDDDECSADGTRTISDVGTATSLAAACETFEGNLAFSNLTGDVNLQGLKEITGDFTAISNHDLGAITANDLEKIGGEFKLQDDTSLRALTLPKLSSVKSINWVGNAILTTFMATEISEVESVTISDSRLSNFAVFTVKEPNLFVVSNNLQLKELIIESTMIKERLDISANNNALNVTFPNLESAGELIFRTIAAVSLPALANVSGALGFYESTFTELSGPNLTSVGSFTIGNNTQLESVDFPVIESAADDIRLEGNEKLSNFSLPELTTVGGAIDIAGNFSSVTFDKLDNVDGIFNLESAGDITSDCDHFNSIQGNSKVIKGKINCVPNAEAPATEQSGNNGGNGGDQDGAASRTGLTAFIGLTGFAMYMLI